MPFDQTDAMKERVKFALEWERRWKATHGGRVEMAELCRMFGISRPTGYLWIARYRQAGHDVCALQEQSRRPLANPRAVSLHVEDFIVDARKQRTLIDAYSRFLLRCEGVDDPNGHRVQRIFDSAFREFGLPAAIRSDNGPPFASTGAGGLTALSVWWLRLGIRLERIEPGKPQQNGRQERFHLTLKLDVPAERDLGAQQRAFDLYRVDYNQERPHEALGQKPPATAYQRSRQTYPRPHLRVEPPPYCHRAAVDRNGSIRWHGRRIHISHALALESVALLALDGERWQVSYGPIELGTLDDHRLDRGLIPLRHRRRRGSIEKRSLDQAEV